MMAINLVSVYNPTEWDSALVALPYNHILQSWDWGNFKSRWDWSAERLLWLKADTPVAAAQILARPIPRTPWRILYVSKGPALDYADISLTTQIFGDLESYARQNRALFIKIDPDVPRQFGEPDPQNPSEMVGRNTLNLLKQRGWRFSPEQIQFRNTILIDLTPEPDEILAQMKSKWRYNIRLAERKGVEVYCGSISELPTFYQMYAETATRDSFFIRPEAYYLDVWQHFLDTGRAELLLASVKNEVVAGLILFIFGQKAWYMYGASTGQHRNLMPNHLLQWQAMCKARSLGCTYYDMWGAPDVFNEKDRMWGVYNFKRGFGGQMMQGLGAFDYPVRPGLYWAFTTVIPKARTLLRNIKPG